MAGRAIKGAAARNEIENSGAVGSVDQLVGEGRFRVFDDPGDHEMRHRVVGQGDRQRVARLEVLEVEEDSGSLERIDVPQDGRRA